MKTEEASGQAMHSLCEADALLTQGVSRILHASSDLPGATHPLHEVLRLSEQQAMRTLEAVDAAQKEIQAFEVADGDSVIHRLCCIEFHLHAIRSAQQSQDLAGQRLKRTIALLQAVESRIQDALAQLRFALPSLGPSSAYTGTSIDANADTFGADRLDQGDVDDLLSHLGI